MCCVLPTVFHATENLNPEEGIVTAPTGFKFPPFVVQERGCSLAEWQRRAPLQFLGGINMLYEAAKLLQV